MTCPISNQSINQSIQSKFNSDTWSIATQNNIYCKSKKKLIPMNKFEKVMRHNILVSCQIQQNFWTNCSFTTRTTVNTSLSQTASCIFKFTESTNVNTASLSSISLLYFENLFSYLATQLCNKLSVQSVFMTG